MILCAADFTQVNTLSGQAGTKQAGRPLAKHKKSYKGLGSKHLFDLLSIIADLII